jgi:hypothetical protein
MQKSTTGDTEKEVFEFSHVPVALAFSSGGNDLNLR